jgi:hypothetical protein
MNKEQWLIRAYYVLVGIVVGCVISTVLYIQVIDKLVNIIVQ